MSGADWPRMKLGEITTKIGSGATPRGGESVYKTSGTPLIRSMNVVYFGFKREGLAFIDDAQANALKSAEVQADDVLLNITGASIGRVTIVPAEMAGARVNQHVCIIRPTKVLLPKFLSAFLSTPQMRSFITEENYGVTRQALTKQQILNIEVPVPSLAEQKRIVDKLDRLLAAVDTCKSRLDAVLAILKRFRQAVLAAATSGQLTEESKGTAREWRPSTLAQVCKSIVDGDHQAPPRAESGVPFLVISNVTTGTLNLASVTRWVPRTYYNSLASPRRAERWDVLYTVTGTIGVPVIVDVDDPFTFQRHIALLKPDHSKIDHRFLWILLGSEAILAQAKAVATGSAQLTIPLRALREFVFEAPSLEKQRDIASRVQSLFACADELDEKVHAALERVEALTQSILGKAFTGEFVPQDPNDEPADKLLERIKAELNQPKSHSIKASLPRTSATPEAAMEFKSVTDQQSEAAVVIKRSQVSDTYLSDLLVKNGKQTPEALWKESQLEIDEFFELLRDEETAGRLREIRPKKIDGDILLEKV